MGIETQVAKDVAAVFPRQAERPDIGHAQTGRGIAGRVGIELAVHDLTLGPIDQLRLRQLLAKVRDQLIRDDFAGDHQGVILPDLPIEQRGYHSSMSTLTEIEAAIDRLPPGDKQRLLLYLAARLRAGSGEAPPPRRFGADQINSWITDDEAELKRFREAKPS